MEFISLILHLDQYLAQVVNTYHNYFYVILLIVIFCETGLVVTPFLPGDSLLFLVGTLASTGKLELWVLGVVVFAGAFLGDNSNFIIGKFLGERLFNNPKSKIFRRDILNKTHAFYEHHGRKTVIFARFIPLIRTFAPFVAGVAHMKYSKFIVYSMLGSLLWVCLLIGGGYLFGNLPIIKGHLSLIILIVMFVSIIPICKMIFDEIRNKSN